MPRGHKGEPRTPGAGRKKGTPNKNKQAVLDQARALGMDPLMFMLHVVNNNWRAIGYKKGTRERTVNGVKVQVPVISLDQRISCAMDSSRYMHAPRKAVDHNGEADAPQVIEVKNIWTIKSGPAERQLEEKEIKDVVAEFYDKKA